MFKTQMKIFWSHFSLGSNSHYKCDQNIFICALMKEFSFLGEFSINYNLAPFSKEYLDCSSTTITNYSFKEASPTLEAALPGCLHP